MIGKISYPERVYENLTGLKTRQFNCVENYFSWIPNKNILKTQAAGGSSAGSASTAVASTTPTGSSGTTISKTT